MIEGRPAGVDISMVFERSEEQSTASLTDEVLHRASLFRADWVGPWTYIAIAAALVVLVPLLLSVGLSQATGESSSPEDARGAPQRHV
jgi:hypothetical protein